MVILGMLTVHAYMEQAFIITVVHFQLVKQHLTQYMELFITKKKGEIHFYKNSNYIKLDL